MNQAEQNPLPQPDSQYSKEEYAALKKAEREELWARVDAQADKVFQNSEEMKAFLSFMADCTPQSTRNLLILYEQDPTITHPRTFDKWAEAGRSLRSGVTGYTFFADQEYIGEDGIKKTGYVITKAFDISQTRGPQPVLPQPRLPEELLAAMIGNSPVPLSVSDQLPRGIQAQYIPKQRIIYVRDGMDENATFCAIAREQAHAHYDQVGVGYYRQAFAAQSYCAAYVAAHRFGIDTSMFHFDRVCEAYGGLNAQEKRGFIGTVKQAAYSINRDIQRSLRELDQEIRPDDFSLAAKKSPKASKDKNDPETSR